MIGGLKFLGKGRGRRKRKSGPSGVKNLKYRRFFITDELDTCLNELSRISGQTRSAIVRQAILTVVVKNLPSYQLK